MFRTYSDAYKGEAEYRNNIVFSSLPTYGVKCLDDALLAIAKNELIVIAAGSGYGKTELSLAISRTNALRGMRVAHYNLEGGYIEAVQRMKWRDICDIYYNEYRDEKLHMDYRKWVLNKDPHPLLVKLEAEVYNKMREELKDNLYLYDNPQGLNCNLFCESLLTLDGLRCDLGLETEIRKNIKGRVNLDLIVIDHLHYFSLDKEENEIAEITDILKTVKKITEELNIPVVLVAHLKKLPPGHGIPNKEDIYGTGNIHKIANTCIIIAPDHERDNYFEGVYPTYFRIAKSRQGLRPNLLMYTHFDIKTRTYDHTYQLYKCFSNGSIETNAMSDEEKPEWAKSF